MTSDARYVARRLLPPGAIVGKSTHNLDQLRSALAEVPDYLAVGPIFPTRTTDAGPVVGVSYLRQALTESPLPVVPIGGIDADNVARLVEAGAERVAVCSAVISAEDPAGAAARIKQQLVGETG